ncbi:YwmB family TATA-box binding protein [Paenibacillus sp. MAHUQ-46]|uniref:YwmB family TATA-box binding protein n=2 Tax=Paenibacillus TaxID=44249 RepID=A0A934IXM7_9BACL|nr:YwmB family TATA-box binding protein [Paenibacillus roseus]
MRGRADRRRKDRGKAILFSLLAVLALGAWLIGTEGGQKTMDTAIGSVSPLQHDALVLWEWADPLLEGGSTSAAWSFRWDAKGSAARRQADEVAAALGLPDGPDTLKENSGGEKVWQSSDTMESARVTLWYRTQTEGKGGDQGLLVLLLDNVEGTPQSQLEESYGKIEEALKDAGVSASPSVTFRGIAQSADAANQLAERAEAQRLESYSDKHTLSETYWTEQLNSVAQSGMYKVNLQLATRQDQEIGKTRLIVGVPLITGDYLQ